MNVGTKIHGQLIADQDNFKNCDLETAISILRTSLKTAISGEGIELYSLGNERFLNWEPQGESNQIRQDFTLILSCKKTKNDVYHAVNLVQAQPLKFTR